MKKSLFNITGIVLGSCLLAAAGHADQVEQRGEKSSIQGVSGGVTEDLYRVIEKGCHARSLRPSEACEIQTNGTLRLGEAGQPARLIATREAQAGKLGYTILFQNPSGFVKKGALVTFTGEPATLMTNLLYMGGASVSYDVPDASAEVWTDFVQCYRMNPDDQCLLDTR